MQCPAHTEVVIKLDPPSIKAMFNLEHYVLTVNSMNINDVDHVWGVWDMDIMSGYGHYVSGVRTSSVSQPVSGGLILDL